MKRLRLRDGRLYSFQRMEMMGVINITPDSFFEHSRVSGVQAALERADQMVAEGATFLDLGGESTRPGADPVTENEETERVIPVVRALKQRYPQILLSVDTYRAGTAREALQAGADLINDISALTFDENMAETVASFHAPVVLMHIHGRPDHIQDDPQYEDVVSEVYDFLQERIAFAISHGIGRDQIMIDLGIGFGKTVTQNLLLLSHLAEFDSLGMPHLLAVSRKSFIGAALDRPDPEGRLAGTVAVTAFAAMHGIEMARVHDVRENLDTARMIEILQTGDMKPEEKKR